jgi:hypothetical protein
MYLNNFTNKFRNFDPSYIPFKLNLQTLYGPSITHKDDRGLYTPNQYQSLFIANSRCFQNSEVSVN